MTSKPTILDIAKRAKVSAMTVSNVMNHPERVETFTREKVLRIIEETNYAPSREAQRMGRRRKSGAANPNLTRTIGMVLFGGFRIDFHPFYAHIIELLGEELLDRGHQLGFFHKETLLRDRPVLFNRLFRAEEIDGLFLLGPVGAPMTERLLEKKLPTVWIDPRSKYPVDVIQFDLVDGTRRAVEYLYQKGHRRIGYLGWGRIEEGKWDPRYQGYTEALASLGLKQEASRECLVSSPDYASAYRGIRELLERAKDLTAVFVGTDTMAFAALAGASALGWKIPADLSMISCNGGILGEYTEPPLTTLRLHAPSIVKIAVDRLLARTLDPSLPPVTQSLSADLLERKSVRLLG